MLSTYHNELGTGKEFSHLQVSRRKADKTLSSSKELRHYRERFLCSLDDELKRAPATNDA
jgi:hypothetical protein